jgi:hypothetical protein
LGGRGSRLSGSLGRWEGYLFGVANPYQDAIILISCHLLSIDEFVFQPFNVVIVEFEL